jgi:hypothetical protein
MGRRIEHRAEPSRLISIADLIQMSLKALDLVPKRTAALADIAKADANSSSHDCKFCRRHGVLCTSSGIAHFSTFTRLSPIHAVVNDDTVVSCWATPTIARDRVWFQVLMRNHMRPIPFGFYDLPTKRLNGPLRLIGHSCTPLLTARPRASCGSIQPYAQPVKARVH